MIKVNGEERPWRAGMTIADLLEDLGDAYHYPVVRLNGRHISRPNFEKTPIPDSAEIFLIPLVAGG
jgi:thiamine biosynthesis protein ThiS